MEILQTENSQNLTICQLTTFYFVIYLNWVSCRVWGKRSHCLLSKWVGFWSCSGQRLWAAHSFDRTRARGRVRRNDRSQNPVTGSDCSWWCPRFEFLGAGWYDTIVEEFSVQRTQYGQIWRIPFIQYKDHHHRSRWSTRHTHQVGLILNGLMFSECSVSFLLKCSSWLHCTVNGRSKLLTREGTEVKTDAGGAITVINRTSDFSTYFFAVQDAPGNDFIPGTEGYFIDPSEKAML